MHKPDVVEDFILLLEGNKMPKFIVNWSEHHKTTVEAENIEIAEEIAKEKDAEDTYCCIEDFSIKEIGE